MDLSEFVNTRRSKWSSLELLLESAERDGLGKLSLADAQALSRLYRSASSDLLWVRARASSADVSGYLNDLVARAYALTYPGKRFRLPSVGRYFSTGFPEAVAREWRMFLAAFLLFFGGFSFGWGGMHFDPNAGHYLVPDAYRQVDPQERQALEADNEVAGAGEQAMFTSFLFTHNIQVAFLAFALGLTAGMGTAVLLFSNGVMLGSLAWVYHSKGMAGWFWAWILPHGIPEITAIVISGAAGFVLARALVAPQGLSRRSALRREGKTALELLLGTLALFVLAGVIEGTVSQIHPPRLPVAFKLTFALVIGIGVYAYLGSKLMRNWFAKSALQ